MSNLHRYPSGGVEGKSPFATRPTGSLQYDLDASVTRPRFVIEEPLRSSAKPAMQTRGGEIPAGEDAALIGQMADGDPVALRRFYDKNSPIVYALCLRILGNGHEAEEVLIDIFYEFWRRAGSFDAGRGSPMGMLMSLTRSRAIDRRRSRNKMRTIPIEDPSRMQSSDNFGAKTTLTPDVAMDQRERRQTIRVALSALQPQQRQAIECAYYDGMSHSEIAAAMDKPLGTVKTYIRQGLSRLRDSLQSVKQDMA